MLRSPLWSKIQATRGACDALVRPYGNGALSTCSIVNASAEQQTSKRIATKAAQRKVFTARDFNRGRGCSKYLNRANGMSEIEGKATRVGANECGQRASFKSGMQEIRKG